MPEAAFTTPNAIPGGARGVPVVDTFADATPQQVWRKYCGFLDLPLPDFMDIQEQLLLEQIELVKDSPLGRRLLRGTAPSSVAEFRANVPLTTYGDYIPFLSHGRGDALAVGVAEWTHTTGAQAGFKWVPYTRRAIERLLDNLMGAFILAAARRHGEVNVWPGDTVLFNTPERPYLSGLVAFGMLERFGLKPVLDPSVSEALDFKDRVREGFKEALGKPVDVIIAMTSVLARVGEGFAEHAQGGKRDRRLLRPLALYRLARAYLGSWLFRHPPLPRDLWPVKAILGWGVDTSFFAEKVSRYWGKPPFEVHACTEAGIIGVQTLDGDAGLAFNPYSDFLEFIPMSESLRNREDSRYQPRTVLLNELTPGDDYEMVVTNFYGMAFLRYRVGHFIRVIAPPEAAGATRPPRYAFVGRTDDRIDLAGFTRMDEKSIWDTINLTGLSVEEWAVRKEYEGDVPLLHMYVELRQEASHEAVEEALHNGLKQVDPFYNDLETMLGIEPLRVTLLSRGSFDRFYDERRAAGAELGGRRPPRMNAADEDIRDLLRVSG